MPHSELIAKILRSKLKYQLLIEINKERITQAQLKLNKDI